MFLRRLTRTITFGAMAIAAMAGVAFPAVMPAQGMPGNGGLNARSGPAAGEMAGTVDSVSTGFRAQSASGADISSTDAPSEKLAATPEDAGSSIRVAKPKRPDFNDYIYYKHKLEFSVDTGVLWINIPFIFAAFVGGKYQTLPMHYTLVPIFSSLRWHCTRTGGPLFLRGNTDLTFSVSLTAIPRGPEKIYGAFDFGLRRNFVYRNWRLAPYVEGRAGLGFIDAKERPTPGYAGNPYAQGEDFTFTLMIGAGARYNFSPRLGASLGATYMHVSNLYLSEPEWENNGINVVGPVIGMNWRIGKPKPGSPK